MSGTEGRNANRGYGLESCAPFLYSFLLRGWWFPSLALRRNGRTALRGFVLLESSLAPQVDCPKAWAFYARAKGWIWTECEIAAKKKNLV